VPSTATVLPFQLPIAAQLYLGNDVVVQM
jgi:hypothetical protein